VIGIFAALFLLEMFFGWPEAFSPQWPRPPKF